MINNVILVGRLTTDPELRKTENDSYVTYVNLAVQRPFKNSEGNYDTDFIRINIWDNSAKAIVEYAKKGDVIGVKGRIQTYSKDFNLYENDEKVEKTYSMMSIVAERISFINKKNESKNVEFPD